MPGRVIYLHDEARLRVAERLYPLQEDNARAEAASLERTLTRLEIELLALEERLLDPWRLSVREQRRLKARRRELFDELSLCYDARLEPPPPYYALERGVEVTAEPTADGFAFCSESGVRALLRLNPAGIGHLTLQAATDRMTLTWALEAAICAITRLAFERLEVWALQLQSVIDLRALGFVDGGEGWWVLSRARYERLQGFLPSREKA